ncbi:FAD-binding domain-containing protein [Mycena floridula]|nr:FAD-binding domain-containing protein [Mycena floridula]
MFGGTALLALLISASTSNGQSFVQPSAAQWRTLNATVQGRLLTTAPFARPCFQQAAAGTLGNFSAEQCEAVQKDYLDPFALTAALGAYTNGQWETCQSTGAGCLLDQTNPRNPLADAPPKVCSQGSVPEFAVQSDLPRVPRFQLSDDIFQINVLTPDDVVAGFKFSKATGVPLVIKNTGHDYKGRSSGAGALSLWTHDLKSIQLENNFVPQNCPKTTAGKHAVTVGAGIQFSDLVAFADANKVTIPTGGCITVGAAGGYTQGGGHGLLSNTFGLGVDRVLQYEVVTPRGEHLIVNECSNPDLFWAMRGGGGGTFGVVLKMTTLVFPEQTFIGARGTYDGSIETNRRQFVQFMANHSLELTQQSWGSYIVADSNIILANPKLTLDAANASIAKLRDFMTKTLGGTFTLTVEPNYKALFDNYISSFPAASGINLALASRFIPVEHFQTPSQSKALSDALDSVADKVDLTLMFQTTPFLFGGNNNTSVNPIWRKSIWQVILVKTWNFDASVSEISSTYSELTAATDVLREMTPDSGGYLNESDVYEPDHEVSFWGANYDRLLEIKNKYDPDHLLDVWHGVGWLGKQNSKYKCYI